MQHRNRTLSYLVVLLGLSLGFATGCHKKTETAPAPETSSVTDQEGNVYKTIKIGDQWWMAENLKVKTFRNGDPISLSLASMGAAQWANMNNPACCFYDSSSFAVGLLLYNWYAVSDTRQIAPSGWHIPTDDEWKTLEQHLGMSKTDADKLNWRGTNEGDKLKRAKANSEIVGAWQPSYNAGKVWPTNESGFTALAGSCRVFNGIFGDPGTGGTGFWWSSTSNTETNGGWYRYLDYNKSNVFRFYGPKTYGFSVRCIKDVN